MAEGYITTAEMARRLGVHRNRAVVLCREQRLPAVKVGGSYLIRPEDLYLVEDRRPGRPRKVTKEETKKEPQLA